MRVFNLNQKIFTIMGICPPPQDEKSVSKFFRYVIRFFMIGVLVIGTLGSTQYLRKFIFDDFTDSLFAIFQATATAAILYMWAVVYFSREGIIDMIQGFQAIHNSSNYFLCLLLRFEKCYKFYVKLDDNEHQSEVLKNANAKSDSFTKFYAIYVILGFFVISMVIGTTQLSYIIYLNYTSGEIKPEVYTLPYTFKYVRKTKFQKYKINLLEFFL